MKESEIKFKIELDENNVPEKIYWDADQKESEGFSVKWRQLPTSEYFRLDRDRSELLLNSRYRNKTAKNNGWEVVLKLLLSVIVRRDFHAAQGKARAKELSALNTMLVSLADRA